MKSKIKHITGNGSYNGKYGETFKFEITMEDDYVGEIGHIKYETVDALPYKVGDEKEYTQSESNGFPKITWVEEQSFQKGGKKDPDVQTYIIRQSSLKIAVDYFAMNGFKEGTPKTEQMKGVAEIFTEYVLTGK